VKGGGKTHFATERPSLRSPQMHRTAQCKKMHTDIHAPSSDPIVKGFRGLN